MQDSKRKRIALYVALVLIAGVILAIENPFNSFGATGAPLSQAGKSSPISDPGGVAPSQNRDGPVGASDKIDPVAIQAQGALSRAAGADGGRRAAQRLVGAVDREEAASSPLLQRRDWRVPHFFLA